MIGKIYGIFDSSYTDVALIRTQDGLCYEVALKNTEIDKLEPNHNVCFYIKQIFKEDSVILYGFSTFEEKCWFESLTKLDGLGPRTALAILSTFSVDSIHSAIVLKNDEFFIAVPGIGKKIASRIINEMQTSLSKINAKILSHKNLEFNETCKEVKKLSLIHI